MHIQSIERRRAVVPIVLFFVGIAFAQDQEASRRSSAALLSSFDAAHEARDSELLASLLDERFEVEGDITGPDGSVQRLSFDKAQYLEVMRQGWVRTEALPIDREKVLYTILPDGRVRIDSEFKTTQSFPGRTLQVFEVNEMIVSIVDGRALLVRLEAHSTLSAN